MLVDRTTVLVGVFNGGVAGLNCLLREGEIAARDGVQIAFVAFGDLRHDFLSVIGGPF
jgi:hypothetical protein